MVDLTNYDDRKQLNSQAKTSEELDSAKSGIELDSAKSEHEPSLQSSVMPHVDQPLKIAVPKDSADEIFGPALGSAAPIEIEPTLDQGPVDTPANYAEFAQYDDIFTHLFIDSIYLPYKTHKYSENFGTYFLILDEWDLHIDFQIDSEESSDPIPTKTQIDNIVEKLPMKDRRKPNDHEHRRYASVMSYLFKSVSMRLHTIDQLTSFLCNLFLDIEDAFDSGIENCEKRLLSAAYRSVVRDLDLDNEKKRIAFRG
jgi:hypothetical protein